MTDYNPYIVIDGLTFGRMMEFLVLGLTMANKNAQHLAGDYVRVINNAREQAKEFLGSQNIPHTAKQAYTPLKARPETGEFVPAKWEQHNGAWIDYNMLVSEISLHRGNCEQRIRQEKEAMEEIMREVPPAHLARLAEYYEATGADIRLMCLQQFCMDMRFECDEVKDIIEKES